MSCNQATIIMDVGENDWTKKGTSSGLCSIYSWAHFSLEFQIPTRIGQGFLKTMFRKDIEKSYYVQFKLF